VIRKKDFLSKLKIISFFLVMGVGEDEASVSLGLDKFNKVDWTKSVRTPHPVDQGSYTQINVRDTF